MTRCSLDGRSDFRWQAGCFSPDQTLPQRDSLPALPGFDLLFFVTFGAPGSLNWVMLNRRLQFLVWATGSIIGIWLMAWAGFAYFESRKVTADKVRAFVESVPFARLAGAARAKALKELEDKLNALPYDERQRFRAEHLMNDWFARMTDAEKEEFVAATLPTGVKQMINAFEQLPDDKRHKAIDDAIRNLRAANNRAASNGTGQAGTNAPPPISPELEAKIRTLGLKTFYSQSSAQTKAELAPLLEELQRVMESGRLQRQQQ